MKNTFITLLSTKDKKGGQTLGKWVCSALFSFPQTRGGQQTLGSFPRSIPAPNHQDSHTHVICILITWASLQADKLLHPEPWAKSFLPPWELHLSVLGEGISNISKLISTKRRKQREGRTMGEYLVWFTKGTGTLWDTVQVRLRPGEGSQDIHTETLLTQAVLWCNRPVARESQNLNA